MIPQPMSQGSPNMNLEVWNSTNLKEKMEFVQIWVEVRSLNLCVRIPSFHFEYIVVGTLLCPRICRDKRICWWATAGSNLKWIPCKKFRMPLSRSRLLVSVPTLSLLLFFTWKLKRFSVPMCQINDGFSDCRLVMRFK